MTDEKSKVKIVNRSDREKNIIIEPWCDVLSLKKNQHKKIIVNLREGADWEIEFNPDESISIYLPEGSDYELL